MKTKYIVGIIIFCIVVLLFIDTIQIPPIEEEKATPPERVERPIEEKLNPPEKTGRPTNESEIIKVEDSFS